MSFPEDEDDDLDPDDVPSCAELELRLLKAVWAWGERRRASGGDAGDG